MRNAVTAALVMSLTGCTPDPKDQHPMFVADDGSAVAAGDGATFDRDAGERSAADLATPSPDLAHAGCPCPLGWYCDLATNTCVVGCNAQDGCGPGQYC